MDGRDGLCGQAPAKQQNGLHSELSYKRLERGRFLWPSPADGIVTITPALLVRLPKERTLRKTEGI